MKLRKYWIFFIVIIIFFISYFFNKNDIKEYEYGLLYTSNSGSVLSLYDNHGNYLDEKKFNVSGLTFGSFMKNGKEVKNKLYYSAPVAGIKQQDFIVEIDKNNLSLKKINTTGIPPTFFSADEKYIYGGAASYSNSPIVKIDIETNEVVATSELEGQGVNMFDGGNELYVFTTNDESSSKSTTGNLYTLDKSSLKILNKIIVEDISFTKDIAKVNNYIYILVTYDGLDNMSNKVRRINLEDASIKDFDLPFKNLSKIHVNNDDIYIVESHLHREEVCNNIAKIDTKTEDIKYFNAEGNIISSIITDNKFISSDGEKVYIHNLSNFKLEKEFYVKQYGDKVFVSILKK